MVSLISEQQKYEKMFQTKHLFDVESYFLEKKVLSYLCRKIFNLKDIII